MISTFTPRERRMPAATRPSLPLFPLPAMTRTTRPYEPPSISSATRATARPARSINSSIDSGAPASTAAISSGVRIGCIVRWVECLLFHVLVMR